MRPVPEQGSDAFASFHLKRGGGGLEASAPVIGLRRGSAPLPVIGWPGLPFSSGRSVARCACGPLAMGASWAMEPKIGRSVASDDCFTAVASFLGHGAH